MEIGTPDMVACIYNPSSRESDAGGWQVDGQPGLANKPYFYEQYNNGTCSSCGSEMGWEPRPAMKVDT